MNKCPMTAVPGADIQVLDSLIHIGAVDFRFYKIDDNGTISSTYYESVSEFDNDYYFEFTLDGCSGSGRILIEIAPCPENCIIEILESFTECNPDGSFDIIVRYEIDQNITDLFQISINGHIIDTVDIGAGIYDYNYRHEIYEDEISFDIIELGSGGIIISEFLADPAKDENLDGVFSTNQDEFIEFYNNSGLTIDLSGMRISDRVNVRHIFPPGTILPPRWFLVVFGGGNPEISMDSLLVQTSSMGTLSLNNNGDDIHILSDADTLWTVRYGSIAGNKKPLAAVGINTFVVKESTSIGRIEDVIGLGGFGGTICQARHFIENPNCIVVDSFNLALEKLLLSPIDPQRGDTLIWSITVRNTGTRDAREIFLLDSISDGHFFSSALSHGWLGDGTISIQYLPSGKDTTLFFYSVIDPLFTGHSIFNYAGILSAIDATTGVSAVDRNGDYRDRDERFDHNDAREVALCGNVNMININKADVLICEMQGDSLIIFEPKSILLNEELYFSQYLEGDFLDKCLEIFNFTGRQIDLTDYAIEMYLNGSFTASRTIPLFGAVRHNETFVICHSTADSALTAFSQQTDTRMIYNGDDAILLKKGTRIIDRIGQVGFDPGTAWRGGGISTLNSNLYRKSVISRGDVASHSPFFVDEEWAAFDELRNGFGVHLQDSVRLMDYDFYVQYPGMGFSVYDSGNRMEFSFGKDEQSARIWYRPRFMGCEGEIGSILVAQNPPALSVACKAIVNVSLNDECRLGIDSRDFILDQGLPEFYNIIIKDLRGNLVDISEPLAAEVNKLKYELVNFCDASTCWGDIEVIRPVNPFVASCDCAAEPDGSIDRQCSFLCLDEIVINDPVVIDKCTGKPLELLRLRNTSYEECGDEIHTIYSVYRADKREDTICVQRYVIAALKASDIQLSQDTVIHGCDPGRLDIYQFGPYYVNYKGERVYFSTLRENICDWKVEVDTSAGKTSCAGLTDVMVRWRLKSWCSDATISYNQTIRFTDDVRPTIETIPIPGETSPLRIYRSFILDNTQCTGVFRLSEMFNASDDCTPTDEMLVTYELKENMLLIGDSLFVQGAGLHNFRVSAIDRCGNLSTTFINIEVRDRGLPMAICRDIVISTLDPWVDGRAKIPIHHFDAGSYDACGEIIFSIARRLDNKFTCRGESLRFVGTDSIEFCCEDIGKDIPVLLQVFDNFGNSSRCTLRVQVRELSVPTLFCEDIYVDCRVSIYPEQLAYPAVRALSCYKPSLIYKDSIDNGSSCNYAIIHRRWTEENSKVSCMQRIFIRRADVEAVTKIRFPLHYDGSVYGPTSHYGYQHHTDVSVRYAANDSIKREDWQNYFGEANVDPTYLGTKMHEAALCGQQISDSPIIEDEFCTIVGFNYEDNIFLESGCQKLVRKWVMIDWCSYNPQMAEEPDNFELVIDLIDDTRYFALSRLTARDGVYRFAQVIKQIDQKPLYLQQLEPDVVNMNDHTCQGIIDLSNTIAYTGGCKSAEQSLSIIVTNEEGEDVYQEYLAIVLGREFLASTDPLPVGQYLVRYVVHDRCVGDVTFERYFLIRSSLPPALICHGRVSGGKYYDSHVSIRAASFIKELTQTCSPLMSIGFSLSGAYRLSDEVMTPCPQKDTVLLLEIIARDVNNNESSCFVYWQVAAGDCPSSFYAGARTATFSPWSVSMTPNPFSDIITIDLSGGSDDDLTIEIWDTGGRRSKVFHYTSQYTNVILRREDFNGSGVYIIKISQGEHTERAKLVLVD